MTGTHQENALPVVIFGADPSHRMGTLNAAIETGLTAIFPTCENNVSAFSRESTGQLFFNLALPTLPTPSMLQAAADSVTERFGDRWTTFCDDDYLCETSANLSSLGGIPTFPSHAALTTLHKNRLRARWNDLTEGNTQHLMPVEQALLAFDSFDVSSAEIRTAMKSFSKWESGAIIKPNALFSSIEVHRVDSFHAGLETIRAALSALRQAEEQARNRTGLTLSPHILVEEAIPRRQEPAEYSVEILSTHGEHQILGVTEKWVDLATHVELGHTVPARSFPAALYPHMVTSLRTLLGELEVQNCLSHWEFIVTPDERVALVEGQLRPAGGKIPLLYQLATGKNPYPIFFRCLFQGSSPPPAAPPSRVAALRMLAPERPIWKIEEIVQDLPPSDHEGLFLSEEDILDAEDWRGPLRWNQRFATAVAIGGTKDEAEARCAALAGSVVLRGRDEHGDRRESRLVLFGGC